MKLRALLAALALGLAQAASACASVDAEASNTTDDPQPTLSPTATTEAPTTTARPPTTATPTSTEPPTTTTTEPAPDQPVPPADPGELAEALSEAEVAIRDPAVDAATAQAWGRRQQQLYRTLSSNPDWGDEVVGTVDPAVRNAVELNWSARQNLSALVRSGPLSDTLPAWRITEPLPAEELMSYYQEAEAVTGVPWPYLAAINLVETRMGRIEGLSTAGAVGPMQFLPSTWELCCEGDPTDDRDAINGAAVYLTRIGAPEDMPAALFSYNRSDRYVEAVTAYAAVLADDPLAYRGYHGWEVYFLSAAGLIRMPAGYEQIEPVDAATWIEANPDALVGTPD